MLAHRSRSVLYSSIYAACYSLFLLLPTVPVLFIFRIPLVVLVTAVLTLFTFGFAWLSPRFAVFLSLLDRAIAGRPPLERQAISNVLWGFEGFGISGAFLGSYFVLSAFWCGCAGVIALGAVIRQSAIAFAFALAFGVLMLAWTRPRLTDDEESVVAALRQMASAKCDFEVGLQVAMVALDRVLERRTAGARRTSAPN